MKFRIIELKGKYRAQVKRWFWWYDVRMVPVKPIPCMEEPKEYDTREEAIEDIKKYVVRFNNLDHKWTTTDEYRV